MTCLRETLMGMMGERRLLGRVETRWQAALFVLSRGELRVAEVCDVSAAGFCLRVDVPLEAGESVKLCLRDDRGAQASITGSVAYGRRPMDSRVGIVISHASSEYFAMLAQAFYADMLASSPSNERQVDFGLMPLPSSQASQPASESRPKVTEKEHETHTEEGAFEVVSGAWSTAGNLIPANKPRLTAL